MPHFSLHSTPDYFKQSIAPPNHLHHKHMSQSSHPSASQVSIKLHMHRKSDIEIRRFSCPDSFDALTSTVGHLWGVVPKHLALEYTDDEGDRVRMTTEVEWEECLRLFHRGRAVESLSPLVLHAFRSTKHAPRGTEEPPASSPKDVPSCAADDSDEPADAAAAREAKAVPSLPPLGALPRETPSANGGSARRASSPAQPRSARLRGMEGVQHSALALMSELFEVNAEALLCSGSLGPLTMFVRHRTVAPGSDEVHVDIQRMPLRRAAVMEGNRRIDNGDHIRAERLISLALQVFEEDAVLAYNLACALARQAKVEQALDALDKAIQLGYTDADHVMRDTDLVSIRGASRFNDLVRAMRTGACRGEAPQQPSACEPAQVARAEIAVPAATPTPQPPVATPPPVAPAVDALPVPPAYLRLLEMFPHLTAENAARLFSDARGDLSSVVNRLLS